MRPRTAAGTLAPFVLVLVLAACAEGAVSVRQSVALSPSAMVPVTLAAGTAGTTTVGASATSATTSAAVLPVVGDAQALRVVPGAAAWTARVRALGVTGAGVLDGVTITLGGTTQVVLTGSSVTQSVGGLVALPAGGAAVPIVAAGACVGTCTFTLHIEILAPGSSALVLQYPYTLAVT